MTNMSINRRTLLTGAVALGTVGLLAACGGNKKNETNSALGAGDDISKAVSFNPKDRSELKEGGELRLAFSGIPENFNPFNTNGYTSASQPSPNQWVGKEKDRSWPTPSCTS